MIKLKQINKNTAQITLFQPYQFTQFMTLFLLSDEKDKYCSKTHKEIPVT